MTTHYGHSWGSFGCIGQGAATSSSERVRTLQIAPNRTLAAATILVAPSSTSRLPPPHLGHVLRPSQTRIERWRIPNRSPWVTKEESDADCFPYRITAAEWQKSEKPLSLLLCCRQLYLEGIALLYSTTFVFEMPLDLYTFQLCVSPDGLRNVKRLIIAFGQINWPGDGPLFLREKCHPCGSLEEWENAVNGLKNMRCLYELQVLLGHGHVQMPESERRPWKKAQDNQILEQRHQNLFDLFSIIDVPNFMLQLTWNPVDLLSRQTWPFQVKLHTKNEMMDVIWQELQLGTEPDLYDW